MVGRTDRPAMSIAVDWDVKQQKQTTKTKALITKSIPIDLKHSVIKGLHCTHLLIASLKRLTPIS